MKDFIIKNKLEIKKYFTLLIANFCLALALSGFVAYGNIMTGGLGGISIFVEHFFPDFKMSYVVTATSILFFIIGLIFKGKNFALKTLFGTICYPLFVGLIEWFLEIIPIIEPATDTGMQIVYSIVAGVFVGLGLGLAFKVGGSTGGVDIPAVIIAEKFHISIDKVVFVIDAVIIALGIIPLGLMNVIIGLISNIVYTVIIDRVLVGGKKSIFVQIISKENEKVNAFIQNELDRGSTFFNVQGGYKGDEHRLLEVIVYRREYSRLIDYIHSVDKNAFVISLESKEVFGEGFKQYDKESIK
jgi:uncharacterized membrane-anchored protein YitT (DUF2179 family)